MFLGCKVPGMLRVQLRVDQLQVVGRPGVRGAWRLVREILDFRPKIGANEKGVRKQLGDALKDFFFPPEKSDFHFPPYFSEKLAKTPRGV